MDKKKSIPEYLKSYEITGSFEEALVQLRQIVGVLRENGFKIPEHLNEELLPSLRSEWDTEQAFPIAKDGMDGIRAIRNNDGTGFIVCFTNDFANRENPRRMEITEKLREKGFEVV